MYTASVWQEPSRRRILGKLQLNEQRSQRPQCGLITGLWSSPSAITQLAIRLYYLGQVTSNLLEILRQRSKVTIFAYCVFLVFP